MRAICTVLRQWPDRHGSFAGIQWPVCPSFRQQISRHSKVSTLHRVHVGAHEGGNIDARRRVFAALPAWLTEFGLDDKCLIGQEFLLGIRIGENAITQPFIGTESRGHCSPELNCGFPRIGRLADKDHSRDCSTLPPLANASLSRGSRVQTQ